VNENLKRLESRVTTAAEATLAEREVVSSIAVLERIGWLARPRIQEWQQGRFDYLERGISTNLHRISSAMRMFHKWARLHGLTPIETEYLSRTPDRRRLRFSKSGDPSIERAYRTHWGSPELSAAKQHRLQDQFSRRPDLVVISPLGDWTCSTCAQTGDFLLMQGAGPVCRSCAGLDDLVFVPAGDALVSRRAKKASRLSAIVVRFSRSRKRYERQGILVEAWALAAATGLPIEALTQPNGDRPAASLDPTAP
jgi:hypothetical protein